MIVFCGKQETFGSEHSYAFVLCHSTCIICHVGVTTFDCSIRAAWVVPPVYPDSCLDASVAVRTCTAITDLKQTPSQQSLDQMYSYHFRYHTSSGYSLHWFRFKWSLYTSNQMILSSFTPPWHFQSASTAVMEEPTICCASEPFSFLPLPCPASCHGNFLISPCHHVK
jgi:hypothetical protein